MCKAASSCGVLRSREAVGKAQPEDEELREISVGG